MPKGGARQGAGRPKGAKNVVTEITRARAENGIRQALEEGLMPLDVIRARMRGETLPNGQEITNMMYEAAVAAAPYLHAKLASVQLSGRDGIPLGQGPDERPSLAMLLGSAMNMVQPHHKIIDVKAEDEAPAAEADEPYLTPMPREEAPEPLPPKPLVQPEDKDPPWFAGTGKSDPPSFRD